MEDGEGISEANGASPATFARLAWFAGVLREQIRPAIAGLFILTVVTGCLFPLALYGVARLVFPSQSEGSLISRDGAVIGSALIGQNFTKPGYLHPRPSAAGSGYDATQSSGTNYGPSNPKLADSIRRSAQAYRQENGLAPTADVPIDAVTSSGSGLDPQISPQNAALQIDRIARTRGLSKAEVQKLVSDHTDGPQLGFLGDARVSVLAVNLALDNSGRTP